MYRCRLCHYLPFNHRTRKNASLPSLPYFAIQSQNKKKCIAAISGIFCFSIIEKERIYYCHHCHNLHFNHRKGEIILRPSLPLFTFHSQNKIDLIAAISAIFFLSIIEKERMYCCHLCHYLLSNHRTRKNVQLPSLPYFSFQSWKRRECLTAIFAIICLPIIEHERMYSCHLCHIWLSIIEKDRMYCCHLCHILHFNHRTRNNVSLPSLPHFVFQS